MSVSQINDIWLHEILQILLLLVQVDTAPVARMCYPAVRHADGDIICVRDCVLVKSGMRKKDIPYVAKIDKFWEDPESGMLLPSIKFIFFCNI